MTAPWGFRWNDPAFAIQWPEDERTITTGAASYPDFSPERVAEIARY